MLESIFFNPWIWIIPIILVICAALIPFGLWLLRRDDLSVGGVGAVVMGPLVFLILGAFYFGAMLPPYDTSYYQTYRITGQVETIESAFSGDEGTMSQVFIATVDGVDDFIRSDDQRFRTLEVGEDVNLVCSKQFRYFQEPWFECSFGGAR